MQDTLLLLLPLPHVTQRCRQESQRFFHGKKHNPIFCYELFRRAILDRSELAWSALVEQYTQFTPLLPGWIRQHPLFESCDEDLEFFVNRSFEKLWLALRRKRLEQFPDLKSLLRYLQMCVHSSIIDHLRARKANQRLVSIDAIEPAVESDLSHIHDLELWSAIEARLNDEQEWIALYCRYIEDMAPREIAAHYSDLFPETADVYRVIQRVLMRLRRDSELKTNFAAND